jgi:hypothetical protein
MPPKRARAKSAKHIESPKSIETKELLKLLESDPRARRSVMAILALKELGDGMSYPIDDYDDLLKKMSGKPFMINDLIDKKKLRNVVPKYYFPVPNKKDFMKKVEELYHLTFTAGSSAPTLPLPPPRGDESPTLPLPPPKAVAWATRRMASPLRRSTASGPSESAGERG